MSISFDCTLRRRDTEKSVCIFNSCFVHFYTFDEGSFSFRSLCDKRVLLPNAKERERDLSEEKRAPHFYSFLPETNTKKKRTPILNMFINKSKKPRAVI